MADPGWGFVGRRRELAAISDALSAPGIEGVVLVGPRGVGKTRLATECLRLGEANGDPTARRLTMRSNDTRTKS